MSLKRFYPPTKQGIWHTGAIGGRWDEAEEELRMLRFERAQVVQVLSRFKNAPLSISSASLVLDLLDNLMDGRKSALCGPKEMGCPPQ